MSDGTTMKLAIAINERLRTTRYPFEKPGVWAPTPDSGESEVEREKREAITAIPAIVSPWRLPPALSRTPP